MPGGMARTPNTGRAKNGNLTSSAESKRSASGGKKMVQTRLPFKILAPAAHSPGDAGGTSPKKSVEAVPLVQVDDVQLLEEKPARKRKLSFGNDVEEEHEDERESSDDGVPTLRRSHSKENLAVKAATQAKRLKAIKGAEDTTDLSDEDDNDDDRARDDEKDEVHQNKKTDSGKKSQLIQIKLPLKNKRTKQRKSLKKAEENKVLHAVPAVEPLEVEQSSSSDDVIELELNPKKRPKLQETKSIGPKVDKPARRSKSKLDKKPAKEETSKAKRLSNEVVDLLLNCSEDEQEKQAIDIGNTQETSRSDSSEKHSAIEVSSNAEEEKLLHPAAAAKPAEAKQGSSTNDVIELKLHPKKRAKLQETKTISPKVVKPARHSKSKLDKKPAEEEILTPKRLSKEVVNLLASSSENEQEKQTIDIANSQEKSTNDSSEKQSAVELSSTDIENDEDDVDNDIDTEGGAEETPNKDTKMRAKRTVVDAGDDGKTLTSKKQKLLEQRRKAREEKERKLQEERRKKQLEKEEREGAKKRERELKEEQRRKEREQKESERRREREEKERKRQAEVDSKNEEKRKRNEAKEEVQRKKDEERRRKEQEKEEAENKKKRAAESFSKFFVPKQPKHPPNCNEHEHSSSDSGSNQLTSKLAFQPFQIKDDMVLAPVTRATLNEQQRGLLDNLVNARPNNDDADDDDHESIVRRKPPTRGQLYLSALRTNQFKPHKTQRNERGAKKDEDDDIQVVGELSCAGTPILEEEPKQQERMRAKYLHFEDNRRPPYYGTWRKVSKQVTPRRPFGLDKKFFDYEVESDCEWEEEEPGESLSASEDEKERVSDEEDYEVDNEWFVPHGHLSDEELQNDSGMEDGNTREAQQAKLQVMQQEFVQEMKKETKKIKPRLIGPIWLDENGNKPASCPDIIMDTLKMYAYWTLGPVSVEPPPDLLKDHDEDMLCLDTELLKQLIRLIHGNSNSKAFLISEYLEFLKSKTKMGLPSKTMLREKIDDFAAWKSVEVKNAEAVNGSSSSAKKPKKNRRRLCWLVSAAVLSKYELSELPLENEWSYTLVPKSKKADRSLREEHEPAGEPQPVSAVEPSGSGGGQTDITKFTKLQEPAAIATAKTEANAPATSSNVPPKKRGVLLMSVPRGQQFHGPTKNALISKYLKKPHEQTEAVASPSTTTSTTPRKAAQELSSTDAASCPTDDDAIMLSD